MNERDGLQGAIREMTLAYNLPNEDFVSKQGLPGSLLPAIRDVIARV